MTWCMSRLFRYGYTVTGRLVRVAMAMASYVAGSPVPLPLPPGPPVWLDWDARAESQGRLLVSYGPLAVLVSDEPHVLHAHVDIVRVVLPTARVLYGPER